MIRIIGLGLLALILFWLERRIYEKMWNRSLFVSIAFSQQSIREGEEGELMEIIERYPESVVFSGHTHRSMTGTLALRSEDGFVSYIHDGVVSAVWDGTQDTYDSQGLAVWVYADYIRVQGRSFADDAWLPLCNWEIALD